MEDDLDAGQQPRCPSCQTLMRPAHHQNRCPACGFVELVPAVDFPKPTPGVLDF